MNGSFNWLRAAEGAAVAVVLAGTTIVEPMLDGRAVSWRAVAVSFAATCLVTFIKGFGQSYQAASVVSTTIVQPAGSTALTETIASETPKKA